MAHRRRALRRWFIRILDGSLHIEQCSITQTGNTALNDVMIPT